MLLLSVVSGGILSVEEMSYHVYAEVTLLTSSPANANQKKNPAGEGSNCMSLNCVFFLFWGVFFFTYSTENVPF